MSVFGGRSDDQYVRVAFALLDSAYLPKVADRLVPYLLLRRYVWRSFKGRLGALYKSGLLVSRATRAKLAKQMGVSHDTVDRDLRWLVKEGWLQKTYHHKRLHFVLGKRSTSAKTGKVKELYLADQVIQAQRQAEQAAAAAAVVSKMAELANAPQHPQNCVTTAQHDALQHTQICGHPLRRFADTPSARLRMMNKEENTESEKENLSYGKGGARAPRTETPGGRPSAFLPPSRDAGRHDEQLSTERKSNHKEYKARTPLAVSDVVDEIVCVSEPVESPAKEPRMAETPEQAKIRQARLDALKRGTPPGEGVPPASDQEPAKVSVDQFGDPVPQPPTKPATKARKGSEGLKAVLMAYEKAEAPELDTTDQAPGDTLGLAKFFTKAVKRQFPNAVIRPDGRDLKWCKQLAAQFTGTELYELVALLVMDWTNIRNAKEFFPPGGDHPVFKDLFRHRDVLATYIGKGFVSFPNYRTSAYQADYARRHGTSATTVAHVVTEEERIKRIREKMSKQAGE